LEKLQKGGDTTRARGRKHMKGETAKRSGGGGSRKKKTDIRA